MLLIIATQELIKTMSSRNGGVETLPNNVVPTNNAEAIDMLTEMLLWDTPDISDANAVATRVSEYFDLCKRHNSKVLISGLCTSLGLTRNELVEWSKGKRTRLTELLSPESASVLQKSLQMLEVNWEFAFANNGYRSPVTGIFLGKNNFGYKDESTNIVKHEDTEVAPDRAKLAAKYAAALPEEPEPAPSIPAKDVVIEPIVEDE